MRSLSAAAIFLRRCTACATDSFHQKARSGKKSERAFVLLFGYHAAGIQPVFLGRFANHAFEQLGKIIHIRDTAALRDCLNLQVAGVEQEDGVVNTGEVYVLGQGYAGFLLKRVER